MKIPFQGEQKFRFLNNVSVLNLFYGFYFKI